MRRIQYSNIKHLEEIREAGFDMPALNQIEVSIVKKKIYCYALMTDYNKSIITLTDDF